MVSHMLFPTDAEVAVPEPLNRTILLLDVERFSTRDDVVQAVLRRTLGTVVDETLAAADVEPRQQYREDRGDGLIVLISGDVPKTALLRALLSSTPELLHSYNRLAAPGARLRLRMVLSAGEVADDRRPGVAGGLVGHDLNQAFRLLDAQSLRTALAQRTTEASVLCVSQGIYEGIVRHGHTGVRPESFHHVRFDTKDGELTAWLHGAGASAQPPEPVDARHGGSQQQAPAQPGAAGAVFHFHGAPEVHGSVVGGDQHGVSGGQVTGDVVLGGTVNRQAPHRGRAGGDLA